MQLSMVNKLPAVVLLFALLTGLAAAQTADASQSSAISALISSYTHSLLTGPAATSIALEVELSGNVPASEIASIASGLPTLLPSFTSGEDLYSFATDPPTTFAEPAWVLSLPAGVRSDVEALRTSVYLAEAQIVASVLGVTDTVTGVASATATGTASASASAAAASSATGAAPALRGAEKVGFVLFGGAVAAVVGAAAFL